MPLGGASILWAEGTPAESDIADAAPIRSIETSIRNAMGSEHNWPSTGGANVGYHLLGSARPFYDIESNVSSTGTDGRLMVTSDTSRFFHVGSAGTMFLGSQRALSAGSSPVGGQNFHWVQEFGTLLMTTNAIAVTLPNSGFSGLPFTYLSTQSVGSAVMTGLLLWASNINPTQFTINISNAGLNSTVHWLSIGTRVL